MLPYGKIMLEFIAVWNFKIKESDRRVKNKKAAASERETAVFDQYFFTLTPSVIFLAVRYLGSSFISTHFTTAINKPVIAK